MSDNPRDGVRIVDVDMQFGSMVRFMIKWAIAAIPAVIILMIIGSIVGLVLGSVTAGIITGSGSSNFGESLSPLDLDTTSYSDIPSYGSDSSDPPGAPEWEVSESRNPIDDSPTVVLSLAAVSPASTMLRSAPRLILRCQSNTTDAYINWDEFLGSDGVMVTTRIGRNAASERSWGVSTDNRASFVPGSAVSFAKQVLAVDTLVARTTPYSESPITATFVVTGLAEKIQPLRDACNW